MNMPTGSLALLLLLVGCGGDDFKDADRDGWRFDAGDCDDADDAVRPGASESPNGVDDDCDGMVDNGTVNADDDGDGFAEVEGDCDDDNGEIHPNAAEAADGVDGDCDGTVDEGTGVFDDDGDGYSEAAGDCDDAHSWVYPFSEERCDGVDNDCSGIIDDRDADGDGFTDTACGGADCDDGDPAIRPDAVERLGNIADDDCDGSVDEDPTRDGEVLPGFGLSPEADVVYGSEADAGSFDDRCDDSAEFGGYPARASGTSIPLTVVLVGASDGTARPSMADVEEAIRTANTWYLDLGVTLTVRSWLTVDDDAYVDTTVGEFTALRGAWQEAAEGTVLALIVPEIEGGTILGISTFPGTSSPAVIVAEGALHSPSSTLAHEIGHYLSLFHPHQDTYAGGTNAELVARTGCDDAGDDLCSTEADPGPTWLDGTAGQGCTYDASTCAITSCGVDATLAAYLPDIGNVMSYYPDTCNDGFTVEQRQKMLCALVEYRSDLDVGVDADHDGYSATADCDDADASVHRGAAETCDVADNDCDGDVDEGCLMFYLDLDGDGWGDPGVQVSGATRPSGYTSLDGDCDDTNAAAFPGAAETWYDGVDQDCDGMSDFDADGDGEDSAAWSGQDCDDADAAVHPSAEETCDDSVDNNCDGAVDEGCAAMHVVAERVTLGADGSSSVTLPWPAGAESCVPLVSWETFIEHPDDQCDFHSEVLESIDRSDFTFWVEHCGTGWYGSAYAAVARAALLCFEGGAGFADTTSVDNVSATWAGTTSTLSVPSGSAAAVEGFCALTSLDGDGGTDFGGACSAAWGTSSSVDTTLTAGCMNSGGETIAASTWVLGVPEGVEMALSAFSSVSGGVDVVNHAYGTSGPDHVAFVLPQWVDTACNDNGSFESACVDDGVSVSCTLWSYGSIDGVSGEVLFLDGDFPELVGMP